MTRVQFLNDLYHHLYGLTRDQAEQHLTYYAEMLADRMEEGMTEEEAVAGMEDVETIARRIMEEEGLPYTPPEERPVTPPSYPDASRLGGGGGTRGYQVPKKMNWRKITQVVLWVVAIAVAVGAIRQWVWTRHDRSYSSTHIPIDYATEQAVPAEGYYEEYYYEEAPYIEGYEYGSGGVFCTGGIDRIDIQWSSGTVYIQSWSEDTVEIREYAHSELSSRTAMSLQEDGGILTIRYRDGIGLGSVKDSKWLTVLVPDGMVDELEVSTASADIQLNGLEMDSLTASTASGAIMPTDCLARKAELSSISGDLILSDLYADTLDVSTTSGGIAGNVQSETIAASTISGYISLTASENLEGAEFHTTSGDIWFYERNPSLSYLKASSTSGDINIDLPYEVGFTLDFSTVSGELIPYNAYQKMDQQGRKYMRNDGGCEIEVETVSGDLNLRCTF